MRRAHRLLLLQGFTVVAVAWLSSAGEDASAKTKKKHGKHAPSASASASASVAPSASSEPAPTAPRAGSEAAPVASSAPSAAPADAPSASASADSSGADTGMSRPTGRDVMLEGIGGLIFGAVPLLAGSGGLLLVSAQSGDKTGGYIALGAATYALFIPMTALGVTFAGHLLDVHGTYWGALIGSAIGSAVAAAPTALLVYEGTRGATVDGVAVMSSLYGVPMLLATIGAVIGWEVSVTKAPKTTGLRRRWVVPGVVQSANSTTLTLSGVF